MGHDLNDEELKATRDSNGANICVGDYVRTDEGYIAQIKEFKKKYTVGRRINKKEEVDENYINLGRNQCKFVESIDYSIPPCYPTDEELERIKKHIVKHSKNITDLIEEGDILRIKVQYHHKIEPRYILEEIKDKKTATWKNLLEQIDLCHYEIVEILTKEQYNANCYRLEE